MTLIEAENISKKFKIYHRGEGVRGYIKSFINREYEEVEAVKNLNLEIDEGEIIGYIGSNGAGKSTTVKMLTGILKPSEGEITVNNINPYQHRKENAMNIGVVFGQKTQLWWDLPVKESFKLLKEIYEVSEEDYKERIQEFNEVLQLNEFWDKPVRKLSLGQKMRSEIAAAFLHHPKIVYLDEPTIGLDVAVKERIREFIKEMNKKKNITVMLTTHDIGDIEDLCERVIVLDEGRKIYDGELNKLVNQFKSRRVLLDVKDPENFQINEEGIREIIKDGKKVEVIFDSEAISASNLMERILTSVQVIDFELKEPNIESVVKKIYNEGLD